MPNLPFSLKMDDHYRWESTSLNFQDTFPAYEQMILNFNYLKTLLILQECQNLIRHNHKRIDKNIRINNPAATEYQPGNSKPAYCMLDPRIIDEELRNALKDR